jgi:tetratricopeptide (TPR) repeat protein
MHSFILHRPAAFSLMSVAVLALYSSGCNTSSGWTRNQVGKSYYQSGNYTAARRSFEQALMNDPYNPDYAFNVAAAMQKQGDTLAAEQMYEHSLSLSPSHQPTYHALAGMLHDQGRTAEAQDLLTAWVETQPYTPESHVEMAWLQQEQGDMAGAEASLQTALKQNPRHTKAMAQLGQVYERSGRNSEAAALYNRSLAYNRSQPQVATRLNSMPATGGASPALMMAQQMPQFNPQFQVHPQFAQVPVQQSAGQYTSMMPSHAVAASQGGWNTSDPSLVSPIQGPLPAHMMMGPLTQVPMPATPAMVGGEMQMGPAMAQPQLGNSTPAMSFAVGQPQLAPGAANQMLVPAPSMPGQTLLPTYTSQPVQLGSPVPISQNPAAGYPAITAVMPVVSAF